MPGRAMCQVFVVGAVRRERVPRDEQKKRSWSGMERTSSEAPSIGPVEVEECSGLIWNCIDWPAYVRCARDCSPSDVARVLRRCWQLDPPRLMLSLLSDSCGLRSADRNVSADLAVGIVRTASAASTWLVTNGLDTGAARLVAAAVVTEKAWQKSLGNVRGQNYLAQPTKRTRNAIRDCVLMGVVDTDKLTGDPLLQRHMKDLQALEIRPNMAGTRFVHDPRGHNLWSYASTHQDTSAERKGDVTSRRHFIDENHSHFIFVSAQAPAPIDLDSGSHPHNPQSKNRRTSSAHTRTNANPASINVPPKASDREADDQLLALEVMLELNQLSSWVRYQDNRRVQYQLESWRIPMSAVLVQGDHRTARICVQYLLRQVPVVVIESSGGCADLLAFAYLQLTARFDLRTNVGGTEARASYIRQVLAPALCARLAGISSSPAGYARLVLRCVLLAHQRNVCLLRILPASASDRPLRSLHEHLLSHYVKCRAALSAQPAEVTSARMRAQLMQDLRLALAWNSCLLAYQLLGERSSTKQQLRSCHNVLLQALTMGDRQRLVRLLLQSGFCARHVLTVSAFRWLMQVALRSHLFRYLCCENMLGLKLSKRDARETFLSDRYLLKHVNRLVSQTTELHDFLSWDELTVRYRTPVACVEQKALMFLSIWSVITGRFSLVHAFWPLSVYPLQLLLLVSRTIDQMLAFSSDFALREQLHDESRRFSELAIDLLKACHTKSERVAIRVVVMQSDHFCRYSPLEIAAHLRHYSFVGHDSCQKWIEHKLMRGMHIRGTKFGDVVDGFKLLLCTFFVFPIRFWIDQTTHSDLPNVCSNDAHYDHTTDPLDYTPINHPASAVQSSTAFGQWLHLVNAPVTKYWVSQLSYLISLMWFTAAMVQSGCGSIVLDRGVCIWLTCLHLENMRCRWRMRRSLLRSPANYWLEDVIALSFAFIFYLARLSPITGPLRPYGYHIRMAGACVLVYHYMKYMNIFLPMHPTLGPLFHHIRLLSLNDLLSFALLCWPFLAGFGVITEVAFYPDRYPFEPHNFQAMLHRTVSSLFKTPHTELAHSNDDCQARITNPYSNATFCRSASFDDVNCNHRGLFPIVFFTSFIFLVKIALITLLFALFNTSMIPLDKLTIWHFQRLNLITTFELINPLPPPFSPIMYMYWIGLRLSATLKRWTEKTPSPNRSDNQVCQQCSNESMLYFWQSIGKSSLEKVESEIV